MEGTFNFINGMVEVVSASDVTVSQLEELGALLRNAANHNRPADQVQLEAAAINPVFGSIAFRFVKEHWGALAAVFIPTLTALYIHSSDSLSSKTAEQQRKQIIELLEKFIESNSDDLSGLPKSSDT